MISHAGTKRVVYAHEESVWAVVHVTDCVDLEELEADVIASTYEEFDKMCLTYNDAETKES
jgi:hypothetical protein